MMHPIIGLMNSGKTLMMTLRGFMAFLKGKKVYSNYYLAFPHVEINRDYLMMLAEEQPSLNDCCFCLDELWIWVDSRGSGISSVNKILSYFFLQSSKDDSEIYFTSQSFSQNDRRLRDNYHRISLCKRVTRKTRYNPDGSIHSYYYEPIGDEKRILSKEEQENLYIENKEYKKTMSLTGGVKYAKTEYIPAKPIFCLYDTRQKIKSVINETVNP